MIGTSPRPAARHPFSSPSCYAGRCLYVQTNQAARLVGLLMRFAPVRHHAIRYIAWVTEWRRSSWPAVGASSSAGVSSAIEVTGAGAGMPCGMVGALAVLDYRLPHLIVGLRRWL